MRYFSILLAFVLLLAPVQGQATDCCCEDSAPEISFDSCACPGDCLHGCFEFEAWAWDDCGLQSFELWLDDELLVSGDCGYICYSLDLDELAEGDHEITLIAEDWTGNSAMYCILLVDGSEDCEEGWTFYPTMCSNKGGECDVMGYIFFNSDGVPMGLPGATLRLVSPTGVSMSTTSGTDADGNEGYYIFEGVECGLDYTVVASLEGFSGFELIYIPEAAMVTPSTPHLLVAEDILVERVD